MQLWFVLAVLLYPPQALVHPPPAGAGAGAPVVGPLALREASRVIKQALRGVGEQVVDDAIDRAARAHGQGWAPVATYAFFARARTQALEGRRALERVELERADEALAEAARIYQGQLERPGVAALWAQVELDRGIVQFELGRAREARRAFRRAIGLDPGALLTEARVRPDVVKAFHDAVTARPRRRLIVQAEGGGEVSVDGVARGPAPVQLELEEGEHAVVLSAPGRASAAMLVLLEGAGLEIQLATRPDPIYEAIIGLKREPTVAGVVALAGVLELDGVIVGTAGRDAGEPVLAAQRVTATGRVTPVRLQRAGAGRAGGVDPLERAAKQLLVDLWLDNGGPRPIDFWTVPAIAEPRPAPVAARAAAPAPSAPPAFYQRPWVWAAALVLASVGIGAGIGALVQPPSYQIHVVGSGFR